MTRITRDAFLGHFRGTEIDLDRIDRATLARLQSAGVSLEELRRIAGADGAIEGSSEYARLFQSIDRLDRNGSYSSFETTTETAAGAAPTPAAEVFHAMAAERRRPYTIAIDELIARFAEGVIDLDRIDDASRQRLADFGVDLRALERLANDARQIGGNASLRQLFLLIDRLDANGSAASFDTSAPLQEGERPETAPTPAGEALAILDAAFGEYDQRFTHYGDLARARTGVTTTPVELAVQHRVQTDPVGCYRTAGDMVRRFDREAYAELEDYSEAHYMARAESARGEIAGWKADFDTGLQYVDRCLDAGRPVVVGVSHSVRGINFDRKTDHFIVISGRGVDPAGRLYYTYLDPATSGTHRTARLYVDADSSMLFRPPLTDDRSSYFSRTYQVTQVRAYADLPLDSTPIEG